MTSGPALYALSVLTVGLSSVGLHAYLCNRVKAPASVLEYVMVAWLWPVYLSQVVLIWLMYKADKRSV